MPTVFKYTLVCDKSSPTGYMFYPIHELEVEYEFYNTYEFEDECIHQFDIEEPTGSTYLCISRKNLEIFAAGLNSALRLTHRGGPHKSKAFNEYIRGMNKG